MNLPQRDLEDSAGHGVQTSDTRAKAQQLLQPCVAILELSGPSWNLEGPLGVLWEAAGTFLCLKMEASTKGRPARMLSVLALRDI